MITLKNDRLDIAFPEIDQAICRLVEEHIESTLPAVIHGDRDEAVETLRSGWGYRKANARDRAKAEQQIFQATPSKIEDAFRQQALRVIRESAANLTIEFQRTMRIPDDDKIYPLPAGFGAFPLRHVDDYRENVPESWLARGGVLMPMYQSEALWISFETWYPFAVQIAAGKVNAVTGKPWEPDLQAEPQSYLVVPEQPWLDGFAVRKGVIRQFIAMPLGSGYSVEEQISGKSDVGGIQVQVFPLRAESYFRSEIVDQLPHSLSDLLSDLVDSRFLGRGAARSFARSLIVEPSRCCAKVSMGLSAGGTMRQEIYEDPHKFEEWDGALTSRCFVHICNSLVWRAITGGNPPHPPFTSEKYNRFSVPWFDYYRDDLTVLPGSKVLAKVKSVLAVGTQKGEKPLTENNSVDPNLVVQYGNARRPDEVREWAG